MLKCCHVQENVARQGLTAMNLTLDFDEVAVLQENMTYLYSTLEVSVIIIIVIIINVVVIINRYCHRLICHYHHNQSSSLSSSAL